MTSQRRAVFLIEMLTVLTMLAIGGSLMAVGLASIHRSQKRVAALSNRYAQFNDFFRVLSQDVRKADVANLSIGDGAELRQILLIGEAPRQVSYRFFKRYVERTGYERDTVAAKQWDPMFATVKIADGRPTSRGTVVSVTVSWHPSGTRDIEPARRFDLAVRCAGELVPVGESDATDATIR